MELATDRQLRENALVVVLTLLTLLLSPLLVVVGALLYVASVAGMNLVLLNETARAATGWALARHPRR